MRAHLTSGNPSQKGFVRPQGKPPVGILSAAVLAVVLVWGGMPSPARAEAGSLAWRVPASVQASSATKDLEGDLIDLLLQYLQQRYLEAGGDPKDLSAMQLVTGGGWPLALVLYREMGGNPFDLHQPDPAALPLEPTGRDVYLASGGDPLLIKE